MNYIELSYFDLALAALLLLVNGALSMCLRLGLERSFAVAGLRMCLQLGLVGLVLKALFTATSPWWTAVAALLMVLFAGREALARQQRRIEGFWGYGIGATSMLFAGTLVTILALTTQIRPDPWFDPRYTIPLLGMILGNTMTGIAISLNSLHDSVSSKRKAIEARLALGDTAADAIRESVRNSMREGLIPVINSMSAAGIVFLPGMMTGQILAGVDPAGAIKYQILIMFLIAGGTGLGVLCAVLGSARRLCDERQRLRLDRLTPQAGR